MTISEKQICDLAGEHKFNPVMLEKVLHLMHLMESLNSHPFLKGKWVLKGGTALNLFIFELPRLSVDIDLNYIGSLNREEMMIDRPKIEQACQAVFSREGFIIKRIPTDHAGGKWILSYTSYTGQPGNLEVDFNFMFRQPLWQPLLMNSILLGSYQALQIPVLDPHELTAGKLAALLARTQARDLYDAAQIFDKLKLNKVLLRIAFIVYGGMNRMDWRTVSTNSVTVDSEDLGRKLIPVLNPHVLDKAHTAETYGQMLVNICKKGLEIVLPFTKSEQRFLDKLLDEGIIDPSLLTEDQLLQEKIRIQPMLQWKAFNVKKHNGLG